jgi:hypothetical protein
VSTKARLLLIAAIHAAMFVVLVALAEMTVPLALLVVAVTFALTSMLNGWPRLPKRRSGV